MSSNGSKLVQMDSNGVPVQDGLKCFKIHKDSKRVQIWFKSIQNGFNLGLILVPIGVQFVFKSD